ncbi:MAG: bifunctional 2-polyprenyl-6-hydroxyphenol methylase/3-demethylubiquinol 3-O-methyltransferase UbiG [Lautropia sp.]
MSSRVDSDPGDPPAAPAPALADHDVPPAGVASNVDAAELDKFQSIASRWWDPGSEFAPLHRINPLRLDWIERHAGGSLGGKTALDVGCGGGILAEAMANRGARVTGIDLAKKSLQVAELHALDSGVEVRYRLIAVETLAAEQPAHYDVVTCLEMLEHVPDPGPVIAACADLARPGGLVCFSTINRNPKAFALAIVGAEYLLRMLPRGTHDYERFIRPSELVGAARRAGLEPIELIGLTYNPLLDRYALVPGDVDVNYLVAMRKPA